MPMHSEGQSR